MQRALKLADVTLEDGRHVNRELVRLGWAWWFRKYTKDITLRTLEAEARAADYRSVCQFLPFVIDRSSVQVRSSAPAFPTTSRLVCFRSTLPIVRELSEFRRERFA
jgi:hypothetical protein